MTVTCIFLKYLKYFSSEGAQNIHPDSEENVRSTREHVQATTRVRTNPGEIDCPVCLGNTQYGIETNCGHIFCGKALQEVKHSWFYDTWVLE